MFVEGVLLAVERLEHIHADGRYLLDVILIEAKGHVDETADLLFVG